MNTPTTIKGFSTSAPEFPEIIGLPLFPLTKTIVNALKERYAILGLQYPNSSAYLSDPEEGFACYGGQLSNIDGAIEDLCSYYFNPYLPWNENVSYGRNHWTWEDLAQKAAALLDIPETKQVKRSSTWNGGTLSTWPVHRAGMISLLTKIDISYTTEWSFSFKTGTFQSTRMEGDADDFTSFMNAYEKAVSLATEKTGETLHQVYDFYGSSYYSFYNEYSVWFELAKKYEFLPAAGFEHLLNGHLVFYGTATPWYDDIFYAFGSPFIEGDNAIPLPQNSGIIFQKTFPHSPLDITHDGYQGWKIDNGRLIGDYKDIFQYGMTWEES